MQLPMMVEHNVREPDIKNMPCEYLIRIDENAAFFQVGNGALACLFNMHAFVGRMCDLDVNRTCSTRCDRSGKVHGKADAREDVPVFGKVNPMLVTDIRPVDSQVDIQHRNRM